MELFFIGIALLLAGYYTYGKFVEKVIAPDDRQTPAVSNPDGVDFVPIPRWKNMLIQLLNIAGVGPVIGVILGIKFGAIVFIIIPIGNIIAGAAHDMLSGMMSIRSGGANLPKIIRSNLGRGYSKFFSVFTIVLLLLVVAVFINVPANLIDKTVAGCGIFWWCVGAIFAYYVVATLFPVDKIIGKVYPFFGLMLLVGTFAVFVSICARLVGTPELLDESAKFASMKWTSANGHPIIPLLFVTIACGIISGFHGTQSPIVARTMRSEREARSTFYGMMVVEGLIAMIWAAAGLAIYNLSPELFSKNPTEVLIAITSNFLGRYMGPITVLAVVILAVTSGDTAMRSMRLSFAEMLSMSQKPIRNRILVTIPLMVLTAGLLAWSQISAKTFNNLWNYFAWGNQVLAASTLLAAAVWLFRERKNGYIALIPGMFMLFIVLVYIIWISPAHGGPAGFGVSLDYSYAIGGVLTGAIGAWAYMRGKRGHRAPKSKRGDTKKLDSRAGRQ
ncbi:MAG: carbon starvation protein A [Opitutales bacterium]|nr:carbon starvation protein A [Opitutales bacterium]